MVEVSSRLVTMTETLADLVTMTEALAGLMAWIPVGVFMGMSLCAPGTFELSLGARLLEPPSFELSLGLTRMPPSFELSLGLTRMPPSFSISAADYSRVLHVWTHVPRKCLLREGERERER